MVVTLQGLDKQLQACLAPKDEDDAAQDDYG
jgi:hypothetical protein